MIDSGLYRGRLWHRRFEPTHAFERDLLVGMVDVATLDAATGGSLPLVRGWPIVLRGADHLPDPRGRERSLAERVVERVTPVLGRPPSGEMALVSQPRAFGFSFDPASFVYCLGPEGIEAVVVEVTNTPWGERHVYVLVDGEWMAPDTRRYRADKVLHVSPFFGMDHTYTFDVSAPGERLRFAITNHRAGRRVFQAGMTLDRIAPIGCGMSAAILRHAFMPAETLVGIYAHAAMLAWKRAPFHAHPRKRLAAPSPSPPASVKRDLPRTPMSIASTLPRDSRSPVAAGRARSWLGGLARSAVLRLLSGLEGGAVVLREDGREQRFGDPAAPALHVTVRSPRVYARILREGSLGAGRAWIEGGWECDDLPGLLRLLVSQPGFVGPGGRMDSPLARAASVARTLAAPFERNSKRGSRRNIAAHYDLGNAFYEAMLDPSMTYSSALFSFEGEPLESAQAAKYDRLCRQLELRPGHRLLEIGTGWGGFAMHAAKHYGCRVTTTTISREQREYALERVERAGLSDRVEILFEDYRDLRGRFDRLVSIEMIEAVGAEYLDTFMRVCSDRLEANGAMGLQAIVIADQLYERSRRHVDFIKRYVFPGGFLPSIAAISDRVARVTDLRIQDVHDLTPDYAETLRRWRTNLEARPEAYASVSPDREFERLWQYYLAYCEAGFEARRIGCIQMTLTKSGWRPNT